MDRAYVVRERAGLTLAGTQVLVASAVVAEARRIEVDRCGALGGRCGAH